MGTCDCAKEYWFIDKDGDGWYGSKEERTSLMPPSPQHLISSMGKDCDGDTIKNITNICKEICKTSKDDLQALFPNLSDDKATKLADLLNKYALAFDIDSKEKLQHLLSQIGVESDNFTKTQEDTAYQVGKVKGIFGALFTANNKNINDFGTYIKDGKTYVQDREGLFNFIYDDATRENTPGWSPIGNDAYGDGWKYLGRGLLQLTGKENYTQFTGWYQRFINPSSDFVTNPNQVSTNFEVGVLASMWFFRNKVMSTIAIDKNTSSKAVTYKINSKGLKQKERAKSYDEAKTKIKCN